jgi:hypothetical protein
MGYNDFVRFFFNHVIAAYHINRNVAITNAMMVVQYTTITVLSRVVRSLKKLFFIINHKYRG